MASAAAGGAGGAAARPVAIPTGVYEVNLDMFYMGARHVGLRTLLINVTDRELPPVPLNLPHGARIRV